MDTCLYKLVSLKEQALIYKDTITHFTLNYIDDSSNAIASFDPEALQKYRNNIFLLLEQLYNANMLTLNSDKTKLLVTYKTRYRKQFENITLSTSYYTIYQVSKIKLLGIYISNILDNRANINNIIQKFS